MYEYAAKVKRVIDGDSIVLDIDLGFDVILKDQSIRLLGIDAPESRTRDAIEKVFGNLAKERVIKFCEDSNNEVFVETYLDSTGKFGRILGRIHNKNGENLNQIMLESNLAVSYFGQNKDDIQGGHLLNRKALIDGKIVDMTYAEAGIKE
jgi:endonuclease YncB( thermonuclease family)